MPTSPHSPVSQLDYISPHLDPDQHSPINQNQESTVPASIPKNLEQGIKAATARSHCPTPSPTLVPTTAVGAFKPSSLSVPLTVMRTLSPCFIKLPTKRSRSKVPARIAHLFMPFQQDDQSRPKVFSPLSPKDNEQYLASVSRQQSFGVSTWSEACDVPGCEPPPKRRYENS